MEKTQEGFYLCTFKQDFADELDFIAMQVFTEAEYEEWYNTVVFDVDQESFREIYSEFIDDHKKALDLEIFYGQELRKFWSRVDYAYRLTPEGAHEGKSLNLASTKQYQKTVKIVEDIRQHYAGLNPESPDLEYTIYEKLGNMGDGFTVDQELGNIVLRGQIQHTKVAVAKGFYDTFKENGLDKFNNISVFELEY